MVAIDGRAVAAVDGVAAAGDAVDVVATAGVVDVAAVDVDKLFLIIASNMVDLSLEMFTQLQRRKWIFTGRGAKYFIICIWRFLRLRQYKTQKHFSILRTASLEFSFKVSYCQWWALCFIL